MNTKTKLILAIPAAIAIISVAVLLMKWIIPDRPVVTGIVEAKEIDVASKIPGRVDTVFVHEGDHVQKGQVLA
ncbi:MAG TPA: biotin/lipoyl-binding protein, partial [Bacteroidota bacterium]|nr:biotin/lipoyl-binding protein [Bacteroidota bacterium]